MVNIKCPTTEEYLQKYYDLILSAVNQQTDARIQSARGMGKTSLIKFLIYSDNAEKFRKQFANTEFVFLDLIDKENELYFWCTLALEVGIEPSDNQPILVSNIGRTIHQLARVEEKKILIFIRHLEQARYLNETFIQRLVGLKNQKVMNIQFVLIEDACHEIKNRSYHRLLELLTPLNLHMPIRSKKEIKSQFIGDREKDGTKIKFPDKFFDQLYALCGGISSIVKKIVPLELKEDILDSSRFLGEPSVKSEIVDILEGLDKKYVNYMQDTTFDQELFDAGLIDKTGNARSSLIREFLKKYDFESISKAQNYDNSEDVLTPQELRVFQGLLKSRGTAISRDNIATLLWGSRSIEKYSDWAIDTVISRIRKKLPDHDIQTIKGFGFMLKL